MKKVSLFISFFILLFFAISGCFDEDKDSSILDYNPAALADNSAILNVKLVDAPILLNNGETVEEVNIVIKRVDVVKKCEHECNEISGENNECSCECKKECTCECKEECNCEDKECSCECKEENNCLYKECSCECKECNCECNEECECILDKCVFTVLETDLSLNLLEYVNGNSAPLGSVELEPGEYLQLRLVVDIEQSTIKFAGDDNLYYLQIPSGGSSGIKIKGNARNPLFIIEEGEEADLVIDFDAQMSIVANFDKDKYILKPVIKEVKFKNQIINGFETE